MGGMSSGETVMMQAVDSWQRDCVVLHESCWHIQNSFGDLKEPAGALQLAMHQELTEQPSRLRSWRSGARLAAAAVALRQPPAVLAGGHFEAAAAGRGQQRRHGLWRHAAAGQVHFFQQRQAARQVLQPEGTHFWAVLQAAHMGWVGKGSEAEGRAWNGRQRKPWPASRRWLMTDGRHCT